MRGYLQPGQWHYYRMVLDPTDASWMVRASMNIFHSCGHSLTVLLSEFKSKCA